MPQTYFRHNHAISSMLKIFEIKAEETRFSKKISCEYGFNPGYTLDLEKMEMAYHSYDQDEQMIKTIIYPITGYFLRKAQEGIKIPKTLVCANESSFAYVSMNISPFSISYQSVK